MRWLALALTLLGFAGTASAQPYDVVVAGRETWCSATPLARRIAEWISVPRAWRIVESNIGVVAPAFHGRVFAVTDGDRPEIVELRYDAARLHIANVPAGWSAQALNVDRAGNMYLLAMKEPGELSLLVYTARGTLLFVYPMGTEFVLPSNGSAIDLAADQCTLYMASRSGAVRRFNVCSGLFESDFTLSSQDMTALRILPDGSLLIAVAPGALQRYSPAGALVEEHTLSSAALAMTLTHGATRVMIVGEVCEPRVIEIDLDTWEEKRIAIIQQDLPMSIVAYFGWSAALDDAHLMRRRSVRH